MFGSISKSVQSCLLAFLVGAVGIHACAQIKPDESILFFPTLAHRVPQGWDVEVHGWVFERETSQIFEPLILQSLELGSRTLRADEEQRLRSRMQWFLADSERGKRMEVLVGAEHYPAGLSEANGHFCDRFLLPSSSWPAGLEETALGTNWVRFTAVLKERDDRVFSGVAALVPEHGLSVISDIDDTIKVSDVRHKKNLMRNTFLLPYQAVPGMAAVYHHWQTNYHAWFHYVSASPWQLFEPLREFVITNAFPFGTFHLKDFRFKDATLFDMLRDQQNYKRTTIRKLLVRYPHRQFVLVGDNGENDPEIYGQLAREFSQQILKIYIREPPGYESNPDRYAQAFRELPPAQTQIFSSASLPDLDLL